MRPTRLYDSEVVCGGGPVGLDPARRWRAGRTARSECACSHSTMRGWVRWTKEGECYVGGADK